MTHLPYEDYNNGLAHGYLNRKIWVRPVGMCTFVQHLFFYF